MVSATSQEPRRHLPFLVPTTTLNQADPTRTAHVLLPRPQPLHFKFAFHPTSQKEPVWR